MRELSAEPEKSSTVQRAITASLRKELNSLETQQERLYEFLESGVYSAEVFVKRNAALAQKRQELQDAIAEAEAQEVSDIDYEQRIIALKAAISILQDEAATAEDKNRLLRTVIRDIVYHRETDVRDKWHHVPFSLDIELL